MVRHQLALFAFLAVAAIGGRVSTRDLIQVEADELRSVIRKSVSGRGGQGEAVALDIVSCLRVAQKGRKSQMKLAPLFDVERARFSRFVESEPPAREWLYENLLPKNIAGQIIGTGGTGKSMTLLQLAMSASAGVNFFGFEPTTGPCRVLLLGTEDDDDEFQRRGRAVLQYYQGTPDWTQEHTRLVEENLFIVSRIGEDNLLTRPGGDGEMHRTEVADRLIETANLIPELALIIAEPISRLRGGRTNDPDHGTRFVEVCEYIRRETGTTFLTAGHTNKTGVREGGGVEMSMGAITVTDSFRWNATMQQLRADQASRYGLSKDEARLQVLLEIPKANYMAPFPGLWLKREGGGVLVPTDIQERGTGVTRQRAEVTYLDVLACTQELLREEGPKTRNQLRAFATTSGPLGAGDKTVRGVIERATRDGSLVERHGLLHAPPEDT